jgi:hypothetical protein
MVKQLFAASILMEFASRCAPTMTFVAHMKGVRERHVYFGDQRKTPRYCFRAQCSIEFFRYCGVACVLHKLEMPLSLSIRLKPSAVHFNYLRNAFMRSAEWFQLRALARAAHISADEFWMPSGQGAPVVASALKADTRRIT